MYKLVPLSYRCFLSNLALIGHQVVSEIFEYYGNIHVYTCIMSRGGGRPDPGVKL